MKLSILTIATCLLIAPAYADNKPIVAINQFVSHSALDAATKGVEAALKENGIISNDDQIMIDNAQGSIANAAQISKHQASLLPKVMVGVATPSAQSQLKALPKNTIMGFVAVTDPKAAGLTEKNILGVTDSPPVEELLDVLKRILPKTKTIGAIYNPGEVNSTKTIERLRKLAAEKGMEVKVAPINNTGDISLATNSIINKVDVLYLPQDNTAVSAADAIIKICMKAKIPVVANIPTLIKNKLLFALGTDYYKDGLQLGNMIAKRLNGKRIEQNIAPSSQKELIINKQVAAELNISIPKDLIAKEEVS